MKKIVNKTKSTFLYEYDNPEERNEHIARMCKDGYVCTKIYGSKYLFAEFKEER